MNDNANVTVSRHRRSVQKLESFADLAGHPSPPIELLQLAKRICQDAAACRVASVPCGDRQPPVLSGYRSGRPATGPANHQDG